MFSIKQSERKIRGKLKIKSLMWEEYELTPAALFELKNEELNDRSSMKKSVNALCDEIRKLGSVNVNAIEEYKELSERHSFLSAQYEDLVASTEDISGYY